MRRATILTESLAALIALCAALPSHAREVCEPAPDPAFAGSVSVDLTAAGRPLNELTGAPLTTGELTYQFTAGGVTFLFESLSGVPLDIAAGAGIVSRDFGPLAGMGFAVTVNPPVSAIGFRGYEFDGCPGAIYSGTGGTQGATLLSCNGGFPCPGSSTDPAFFGAAEIGGVGAVHVWQPASIFVVTELVFVPPDALPEETADLSVVKTEAGGDLLVLNGEPIRYQIDVDNSGPDAATDVLVSDFLPSGIFGDASHDGSGTGSFDAATDLYRVQEPQLPSQGGLTIDVDATAPADPRVFRCEDRLVNVALVGSTVPDPDLSNNLSVQTIGFDKAAVESVPEDCNDGIDNDCDGLIDCQESACTCRPSLETLAGGTDTNPLCVGVLVSGLVRDERGDIRYCGPAPAHGCTVPRGVCGGVTVPAACCDVELWSNPQANLQFAACDVGVPGCAPRDPNWKDSIPGVDLQGYGYTAAGLRMTYILHYENVGNADAHDVQVIDALDGDLDDATLVIHDGGVYDPATRTVVWTDPLVPPATPRQVSFEIEVRSDAPPATRVRNVGTIVFPDAVPPTRIDTNFVEHVVPDPSLVIAPDLAVIGCHETTPGSGLWRVDLGNEGNGFAYDVRASIVDPPASVVVSDEEATFSHPDDPADGSFTTVVPAAITTSDDTVAFVTQTPGDPCAALRWRFEWDDLAGGQFSDEVQESPDRDRDAVADDVDDCPDDYDPTQADADGDGTGDACEAPPTPGRCDVDTDGDVDRKDVDAIFAARGQSATGADDPRDSNEDGLISVNDARICALECTLPECEVPPAPPVCGLIGIEPLLLLGVFRRRRRGRRPADAGAARPDCQTATPDCQTARPDYQTARRGDPS